ncbi:hypothetical protein HOP50_09g54860 [Chloropicon primus]|nr:hypothetical protein HOP50_09g54860 [Chloropicon primus]
MGGFDDGPKKPAVSIVQALEKIEKHIKRPEKCHKACKLLLTLIEEKQLNKDNAHNFFLALRASLEDRHASAKPELRRIYRKLFLSAEANIGAFSDEDSSWIREAFALIAIVRNELFTDDSFVFNKRINFVKKAFLGLGQATVGDQKLVEWRMEALVECLEAAESVYKSCSWTRSATDLLASAAYQSIASLDQRQDLKERCLSAYRSIENLKVERKRSGGPSFGEKEEGENTFDAAVGDWKSKEGVSKRSGQGGGESWRGTSSTLG